MCASPERILIAKNLGTKNTDFYRTFRFIRDYWCDPCLKFIEM